MSCIPEYQAALGIPDGATPDSANREHYLISWPECAISYNADLLIPNCVSWHLCKEDMGDVPRDPTFEPDRDLPEGYVEVLPSDYAHAGYDRGHMCPSADRTATLKDNQAVFETINIAPQVHRLNGGAWEKLEIDCREWASAGDDLFIVCGPVVPTGAAAIARRIGKDGVVVPSAFWKIVLIVPAGDGDPVSRISASCRVIAVLMPNDSSITLRDKWQKYETTVDAIEKITGFTFFSSLPPAISVELAANSDSLSEGAISHDSAH